MNDGFLNEELLIKYINGFVFSDFNNNIQNFLNFTFNGHIDLTQPFFASKCKGGQVKPDLIIEHNSEIRYVSIKKGGGNSVHQEKVSVFFPFFEEICGQQALDNLKLFHYGDDTLDDTGAIRYDADECQNKYQTEIEQVNNIINSNDLLPIFLDRFLFVGNVNSDLVVDVIYHGTIDDGIWASREEIYEYFLVNDFPNKTIHFGSLTYQVWGRNNNYTAVNPDRRYVMQIKWGSIYSDFLQIRRNNR